MSPLFPEIVRVMKNMGFAVFQDPGGFEKLREASWSHFHLSWYVSDSVGPSFMKKMGESLFVPSTVCLKNK